MLINMLSVITSVKDYVEVVHKLLESDPTNQIQTYYDFGAIITYVVLTAKQFFIDLISLNWLQNLWSLPTIVPNIASSMISEIAVLDGYFHNAFTFLETPISYGNQNVILYCLEKFTIGMINSIFLCLPTSIAHLICLRRFIMQGLEAGYLAGLGTIAGNVLWIGSVVFGLRFLIIPWLSLDILRYLLGFILLVKYMWDSYTERRVVLEDLSKWKIFALNFLLAFTEQTNIYPFISNLTISSDSTILESFPAENFLEFISIHGFYLLGILIGSLSLLQLTCWFWENPAFNFYIWMVSSFKTTTGAYYKLLNFLFLYVTMICAISSVTYFGLDYTLTSPLGLVHEDRLIDQKTLLETSFLNTKASDRNTRRNRGRHGRRERWKRRVRRYRTFDASLYDQGVYDLFTIEDLNYGFDRFWLRRKIRNHRVRFRFFPGPWMRSFKKQLARPRLESFMGPRVEFFRILFEQVYHPEFHEFKQKNKNKFVTYGKTTNKNLDLMKNLDSIQNKKLTSIYSDKIQKYQTQGLIKEFSALRKFVRKFNSRIKASNIASQLKQMSSFSNLSQNNSLNNSVKPIYSKRWKQIFSKISHSLNQTHLRQQQNLFRRFYNQILIKNPKSNDRFLNNFNKDTNANLILLNKVSNDTKKQDVKHRLSKKDRQILRYKTFLKQNSLEHTALVVKEKKENNLIPQNNTLIENLSSAQLNSNIPSELNVISSSFHEANNLNNEKNQEIYKSLTLLHPIKFYLQKQQAFQRKLKFYGVNVFRNFGLENNAAHFRIIMKRFFYYYKPTLRWERTMRTATMRKARRKGPRIPRKMNLNKKIQGIAKFNANDETSFMNPETYANLNLEKVTPNLNQIQKPTHFYSLVNKRASRYRYQIYKDVLQHWYYTPFNRLLLKFDVDSFIRRQPSTYFLTKKEENLLHLRRFLLSEHYETLRWYTYMQHYGSMKARIGGTKSFANRAYNQQFQGTLKKIRHLFAITPSFTENTILKFDQPLYNEFNNNQNSSVLNDSIMHEELLIDDSIFGDMGRLSAKFADMSKTNKQEKQNGTDSKYNEVFSGDDLTNQSKKVVRQYLLQAKPIREKLITKLLTEKNYWELTKFLFKGQKIRGTAAITNQRSFIAQEKQLLLKPTLSLPVIEDHKQKQKQNIDSFSNTISVNKILPPADSFQQHIWLALIKKCQNQIYNQESLKLYLLRHIDKHKRQKQKQQKSINERLERMKNWFVSQNQPLGYQTTDGVIFSDNIKHESQRKDNEIPFSPFSLSFDALVGETKQQKSKHVAGLTTAIQKAIKEGIYFQKGWNPVKVNIRNNRPKINWALVESKLKKNKTDDQNLNFSSSTLVGETQNSVLISGNFRKTTNLKNHLKIRLKLHEMQINNIENDLRESLISVRQLIKSNNPNESSIQNQLFVSRSNNILNLLKTTLTPFKLLYKVSINSITQVTSGSFIAKSVNKINQMFVGLSSSNREQNLSFWRKQETNLTKRKKTRKTLKRLKNKNLNTKKPEYWKTQDLLKYNVQSSVFDSSAKSHSTSAERQKLDTQNKPWIDLENKRHIKSWEQWHKKINTFASVDSFDALVGSQNGKTRAKTTISKILQFFNKITSKKFKRKRSRLRRYRRLKNRSIIKKTTLGQKLKRQFKLLKKYGSDVDSQVSLDKLDRENKKLEIFQMITKKTYQPQSEFVIKETKQRRTRQRKHRFWKKHKKQKYAQNKRKQRKRRRYAAGKIRLLNKQLKRIKSNIKVKKWWWESFLPNLQASTDAIWQIENDKQIQKQLSKLSVSEILERDQLVNIGLENINKKLDLQIGDKDYKPLAIPEAIRIRENLIKNQLLKVGNSIKTDFNNKTETLSENNTNAKIYKLDFNELQKKQNVKSINSDKLDVIGQISQNTLTSQLQNSEISLDGENILQAAKNDWLNPSKFMVGINPIPFYAGWDEGLRKFVVTNRLLSKKQAGYTLNLSNTKQQTIFSKLFKNVLSKEQKEKSDGFSLQFSQAPLQGMNAATTLYWQVPFTTYDPDQFFALGMDGFSPIGWRKFHFRHSKQTLKPILVKTKTLASPKINNTPNQFNNKLSYNIQTKIYNTKKQNKFKNSFFAENKISQKNKYRRMQKRYKRVKKHPRPPVWFPSGPLTNQVLPVHYIYVFYKRSRLPRDRYIRRRLRRNKDGTPSSIRASFTKVTDMTLRRRSKPRRKYHRKQSGQIINTKNENLLLKRRAFKAFPNEADRSRPIPENQLTYQNEQRGVNLKYKQRRTTSMNKQQSENLRVRQLRRRVQRQVIRPIWRYRPRAGGFVWPGDYLRLELVRAPKLNPNSQLAIMKNDEFKIINKQRKIRKKKRRIIPEWQVQPKKYLLQKHNLKVLKKKLQKSQNSNKIQQRVKELTYLFKSTKI